MHELAVTEPLPSEEVKILPQEFAATEPLSLEEAKALAGGLVKTGQEHREAFRLAEAAEAHRDGIKILDELVARLDEPPAFVPRYLVFHHAHLAQTYTDGGVADRTARHISFAEQHVEIASQSDPRVTFVLDWAKGGLSLLKERYVQFADQVESYTGKGSYLLPIYSRQRARQLRAAGAGLVDLSRADARHLDRAIRLLNEARWVEEIAAKLGNEDPEVLIQRSNQTSLALADAYLVSGESDRARQELDRVVRAELKRDEMSDFAALSSILAREKGGASGGTLSDDERDLLRLAFRGAIERAEQLPSTVGGWGHQSFHRDRRVVSELIKYCLESDPASGAERGLAYLAEVHALHSLARELRGTAQAPTLEEVRSALVAERQGLLIYYPATDRTHLFVASLDSVTHHELAATDMIRQTAALGRMKGGAPLLPDDVRSTLLSWDAVTIVGSDWFGSIGFEDFELSSGTRVIDRLDVAYLPSLALGVALAERAKPATAPADLPKATFVVATDPPQKIPGLSTALDRLDIDRATALAMFKPYGGAEGVCGPDATPKQLERVMQRNTDALVLHITAHAIIEATKTVPATLVLSGSSFDKARVGFGEVRELPAPPVVVLMACGTARGPQRSGDSSSADLGGAFLLAGAHSVVLSQHTIRLHASHGAFTRFHASLAEGASPARALRNALQSMDPANRAKVRGIRVVGLGHRAH